MGTLNNNLNRYGFVIKSSACCGWLPHINLKSEVPIKNKTSAD